MTRVGHVIYLHGFTSSPTSSKAQRFAGELRARGVGFSCPDFNQPDFETLTTTRMLADTRRAIEAAGAGPVALVGSSLGGFVAVHAVMEDEINRIDRLILLAPALDFGGNRLRQLGPHGIEEWRDRGTLRVFHWADNADRDVGFALYEDGARYDAFALELKLPILIYQGVQDASVDPVMVSRWCEGRTNVDLRLVDDDHQLKVSMDAIWSESERFLGLERV